MFGKFGKNEHITLFPKGVGKIGDHDEREVMKTHLLERIHSYILELEKVGLVVKDSKVSGSTVSFSPERLAEISQGEDSSIRLTVEDVLKALGVDQESLKAKDPIGGGLSTNEQVKFIKYYTNEPTLYYIQQVGLDNTHYDYFQITDRELQRFDYARSSPAMQKLVEEQEARLRGENV